MSSSIQHEDVSGYCDDENTFYIMDNYCSRIRQSLRNDDTCIEADDVQSKPSKGVGLFTVALMKVLARNAANRTRRRLKKRFVINPEHRCKVSVMVNMTLELVGLKKSNPILILSETKHP